MSPAGHSTPPFGAGSSRCPRRPPPGPPPSSSGGAALARTPASSPLPSLHPLMASGRCSVRVSDTFLTTLVNRELGDVTHGLFLAFILYVVGCVP
ncbi:MAG: hypothetical protein ACTSP1_16090 [Candidatus Freyarchaeota archaeon]